jgi:signal transduction histidine kinase
MLERWMGKDERVDERSLRAIQIVVSQAQRLNKMITALLDVSRIQTGRFSIEAAPMDLAALLRRVVEESRLALVNHTVQIEGAQAPVMIDGDEVRLEQMLQNLISNAIKYSPRGGVVLVRLAARGGFAIVSVSDQGIGISPEAQRQLFHRFYRAKNAETYGISGMGIGLFVVKEIVELHGGDTAVESVEGRGSTFTVRLPLRG